MLSTGHTPYPEGLAWRSGSKGFEVKINGIPDFLKPGDPGEETQAS